MSRLGIFPFVGTGHLNPLTALGRYLQADGHDITVFQMPVARAAIRVAGLKFWPLPTTPEDLPFRTKHRERKSDSKWFFTMMQAIASVEALTANARRVLRGGPEAVRASGVDALIVDQHDLAAGSVADLLRLPFVTISLSPPVYLNDFTPLSSFGWRHRTGHVARFRNRLGNAFASHLFKPALSVINEKRCQWGLPKISHLNDAFSKLAIISQLPEVLDFPSSNRPANLFYAGPFHDGKGRASVGFPWQLLDGRPLIYASLGTILIDLPWVFRTIAEACAAMDVQLVLSLGGGELFPEDLPPLPGNPVIVHYAPQIEILRRASLVVTHAGLNTVLESLAQGVPLVAIPIAHDQPGIAARIERAGVGMAIPLRRLSAKLLAKCIQNVLHNPVYAQAARQIQVAIQHGNGLEFAVQVIERSLAISSAPSHRSFGSELPSTRH